MRLFWTQLLLLASIANAFSPIAPSKSSSYLPRHTCNGRDKVAMKAGVELSEAIVPSVIFFSAVYASIQQSKGDGISFEELFQSGTWSTDEKEETTTETTPSLVLEAEQEQEETVMEPVLAVETVEPPAPEPVAAVAAKATEAAPEPVANPAPKPAAPTSFASVANSSMTVGNLKKLKNEVAYTSSSEVVEQRRAASKTAETAAAAAATAVAATKAAETEPTTPQPKKEEQNKVVKSNSVVARLLRMLLKIIKVILQPFKKWSTQN